MSRTTKAERRAEREAAFVLLAERAPHLRNHSSPASGRSR
jgi:hypothetical protein